MSPRSGSSTASDAVLCNGFPRWPVDRDAELGGQRLNTPDMVAVVMGHQDCRQRQVPFLKCLTNRLGVSWIHDCHAAAVALPLDQPDIVVSKSPDGVHLQHQTPAGGQTKSA
jgi:hypothetical protein